MDKLNLFIDGFAGTSLDTTKWTASGVGVSLYGGDLHIQLDPAYGAVTSASQWDLVSSEFVVVATMPGLGETREVTAFVQLNADNLAGFLWHSGTLYSYLRIAGINTYSSVSYSSSTMKWMRLRESSGVLFWEVSGNGVSYTQIRSVVHGQNYSAVRLALSAGFYGTIGGSVGYGGGIYGGGNNTFGSGNFGDGLFGGDPTTDDGLYGGVSGLPPDEVLFHYVNFDSSSVPADEFGDFPDVSLPEPIIRRDAPRYHWGVGPWKGSAPDYELTMASSYSLDLHLKTPSSAKFSTWGYSSEVTHINELLTDLWVIREGEYLFRGRVVGMSDDLDVNSYTVSVDVDDYRGIMDRRFIDLDKNYTISHDAVVRDLIDIMQAQLGGSLGLIYGDWPAVGTTDPISFKTNDSIMDSITKVLNMSTDVEFDIDSNLVATLYNPRGVDNGVVLDFGGVVSKASRKFDVSKYANIIKQTGSGTPSPLTAVLYAANLESAPEGRWETHFADTELNTQHMVDKTAATNFDKANRLLPTYTLTLGLNQWRGPGHLWLGDYATVVVKEGRLRDVMKMRVYDMSISLNENDEETVVVTVGDPRVDLGALLRGIQKRTQSLTKRG
jgi:hypothetical protein